MIWPELIEKLSPGVREMKLRLEQEPENTQLWRDIYSKASDELMMRMMGRIPEDLAISFEHVHVLPEEVELLSFLSTQGNKDQVVCPSHGASMMTSIQRTGQKDAMMCGLCGWVS
jgi:hypothetical protein